ncbi:MAG: response regulator [Fastidiosipilaceae bacterium]
MGAIGEDKYSQQDLDKQNSTVVLIVDDDENIVELLTLYFEKEHYRVYSCLNGNEAMEVFHRSNPDVVLLDLMLPGRDGYDICRDIRRESDVPIIMLTARGDTLDKVVGLELGADDYVQKPFEPQELLARVRAILRRTDQTTKQSETVTVTEDDKVTYPGLSINMSQYTVVADDNIIEMPPKELELFYYLAVHPNRVFTREQLLANVWGYDFFGQSRTVDVHIKRIREKVEEIGKKYGWGIHTVWSVGYKFETFDPDSET